MDFSIQVIADDGHGVTGEAVNTSIKVKREADGQYLDFNSLPDFSASPTTLTSVLVETDVNRWGGAYKKVINIVGFDKGKYDVLAKLDNIASPQISNAGIIRNFATTFTVNEGAEVHEKVAMDSKLDGISGEVYKIGTPAGVSVSEDIAAIQSDTDNIQTRIPAALTNGLIDSNVSAISGEALSAFNLRNQYDATGITGANFPATQSQVGGIGASAGGALNVEATADNVSSSIKGVSFVGVQASGTFVSTEAEDGAIHQITDTGNAIDIIYSFSIGGNRTAASVSFKGFLNSNNDVINVQAFDFVGNDWETRFVVNGKAGSANDSEIITLLSKHTGVSGSDIGSVLIRFQTTGQSSPTLNTDELLISAVNIGQSVGYSDGAIWVNTNNSNTNTVDFVDGVADNPVSTWAAALTLSASLNITRFHITNGSSIALTANSDNYTIFGNNWTLALESQSIVGIYVQGAEVSGIATGSGTTQEFDNCLMNATTHIKGTHIINGSAIMGTQTVGEAGDYFLDTIHSAIAGDATWIWDFGTAIGDTNLNVRHNSGGIQLEAMGDTGTDTASIEGFGQIIEGTCTGGNVTVRGTFTVTGINNLILTEGARFDVVNVRSEMDNNSMLQSISGEVFKIDTKSTTSPGSAVTGSLMDRIMNKNGSKTYDASTDSLEAIRDNQTSANPTAVEIRQEMDANSVQFEYISGEVTGIRADTEDIQARVPAVLVGGRMDSNMGAVSGDPTAADNVEADYDGTGFNKSNSTIGTTTANTDMVAEAPTAVQNRQEMDDNSMLKSISGEVFKIDTKATTSPGAVVTGSLMDRIMNKNGSKTYNSSTDSLEALRDNQAIAAPTAIENRQEMDNNSMLKSLSGEVYKIDSKATVAPSSVITNSLMDRMLNKNGSKTYSAATDSQEAIRDNQATITAPTAVENREEMDANSLLGGMSGEVYKIGTPSGVSVSADIASVQAQVDKSDIFPKNVAKANFAFLMVDTSDNITGKTGLTVTATRRIDGGSFSSTANSVSEVANGIYSINLAASDLNGDVITFQFTAPGAGTRFITIVTQS